MKHRMFKPAMAANTAEDSLCRALLALGTVADMRAFLRDLCTPAEIEALTDRWRVVPLVLDGHPYRDIHEQTGVSVTTIGRVARFLGDGNGGYAKAFDATKRRQRSIKKTGSKS